jgi:shikimate kinase
MKIILIGYRCTGKTSVGKRLAERLRIPFYDTDDLIQGHTGKTIGELVDEEGWDGFRTKEREIIKQLPLATDAVIAAGGGAIMDAENRDILKQSGLCVWLTADVNTILQRMRTDQASGATRPPLSSDGLERETVEILRQRTPIYRRLADFSVDTSGKKIEAIADEVCSMLACQRFNAQRPRVT